MASSKQKFLSPDMEPKRIKEIEDAAADYEKVRDERMALTEREVQSQIHLLNMMKKHGFKEYNFGRRKVYVLPGNPKAKVQAVEDAVAGDYVATREEPETPAPSESMTQAAATSLAADIEATAVESSGVEVGPTFKITGLTHAFKARNDMVGVCRFCGFGPEDGMHEPVASGAEEQKSAEIVTMPKGRKKK